MSRLKHTTSRFDLDKLDTPMTRAIRTKVQDIAGEVPDAKEMKRRARKAKTAAVDTAHQARDTKVAEAIVAGVGAALPFISSALAKRHTRQVALQTARRAAPVVVRTHPVLAGFAAIGGAAAATVAVRSWMRRRAEAAAAEEAALIAKQESKMRWEDDGG